MHTAFGVALHNLLKKKINDKRKTELFFITTDVIQAQICN